MRPRRSDTPDVTHPGNNGDPKGVTVADMHDDEEFEEEPTKVGPRESLAQVLKRLRTDTRRPSVRGKDENNDQ